MLKNVKTENWTFLAWSTVVKLTLHEVLDIQKYLSDINLQSV